MMIFTLWEYLIIVIEAILFFLLVNLKLTRKKEIKYNILLQVITLFIGTIALFIANMLNVNSIYTISVAAFIHFIFLLVFFSDKIASKFFWTICYTSFAIISDFLSSIIPMSIFNFTPDEILKFNSLTRVEFTLLYILIFIFLIVFALSIDEKIFHLSQHERITFTILSFFCILIEHVVLLSIIALYYIAPMNIQRLQSIIFILVFFLYISMVVYVYKLGKEKELTQKLSEDLLLSKINELQLEQVTTSIENLRGFKHDINNHLATLSSLINKKHYTEATEYINKINENLNHDYHLISSGNSPVDCIVSNKLLSAHANNISVTHTIHLPDKIILSSVDICSLLGNLLDNAIESCNKLPPNIERKIILTIKPFNNMLSIKIQNSSNGIYSIDKKGNFISTKSEFNGNNYHGIGIKQIKNITEKYNGITRFTPENNLFTVEILFPLSDTKEANT